MALRILCYHQIDPAVASDFSAQLDYFKRSGYQFVSLTEGLANFDQKCLTVSFDDGDATLCEVAQPIIDSMGIKGIVYLNTDYVIQGSIYKAKRFIKATSWDKLGHWLAAGHEIGSHTHSHIDMVTSPPELALEELELSRTIVKQELGIELKHFAYPWGLHDAYTRQLFADNGTWATAATTDRGFNTVDTDHLCLKRDLVYPDFSLDEMRLKMSLGDIDLV